MNISILYHSVTGNTKRMAEVIAEGMSSVEETEVRLFPLDDIDDEFVKASDCVVFGTPSYLAGMTGEMTLWLERKSSKYGLAGKLGGAFATADYVHGGGDMAVQGILTNLMVRGMLAYSGGGSWGKPYIHLGPVAISGNLEKFDPIFRAYGERMAREAHILFGEKK